MDDVEKQPLLQGGNASAKKQGPPVDIASPGCVIQSASDLSAYFTWKDVSYTSPPLYENAWQRVRRRGKTRQILFNVFGAVRPGECLAIMGPSGSGKTTLLDILAFRKNSGAVSGEVLLNGRPPHIGLFKRIAGLVVQHDILIPYITVREALMFVAQLRLSDDFFTDADRAERVQHVIDDLKLSKVADARIGNADIRGLSGGERKRVSIGVELITQPPILFLDEPTTGLDSKTALDLCLTLRQLASVGNRSIVYTIHQPRSNIYRTFDKLLLLGNGRVVFNGDADQALAFFEASGFPCEEHTSAADHFLDVIAGNDAVAATLHEACMATEQTRGVLAVVDGAGGRLQRRASMPSMAAALDLPEYATGFWRQCWVLLRREVLSTFRNPRLFWMQLLQSALLGLIAGSLWSRTHENKEIQQVSALFFVCAYTSMMTFSAAPHLIAFRSIFYHETSSGCYRVSSYLLAKTAVDIPHYCVVAVSFAVIIFFWAQLPMDTLGFFVLETSALVVVACSSVSFIGAFANTVSEAMAFSTFVNGLSMLFSGFLAYVYSLPRVLLSLYYLSFMRPAFSAYVLNNFDVPNKSAADQEVLYLIFGSPTTPNHIDPGSKWSSLWQLAIFFFVFRLLTYFCLRVKPKN